ncbi:MAG: hypothetical protein HY293_21735 [Planctomycetes bacterium]|nr:hypothetical protein [Planctomycetota bacterium]
MNKVLLLLAALLLSGQGEKPVPKEGLASLYPGDEGLERDPRVLFTENFESDPKTVTWMKPGGWFDGVKFGPGLGMEISDKVPAAGGKRCLQYNLKTGKQNSGGMFRVLKPSDCVYVRYYRMFEKDWSWPQGYGPHDSGLYGYVGDFKGPTDTEIHVLLDFTQSADTFAGIGTPRQEMKDWGAILKKLNLGTNPVVSSGVPWNKARPDKIEAMKWHCVEYMVKLSSPGKSDGAVKVWVNGKPVSDAEGLPLRDAAHADLMLNLFFIGPYFHPGSPKDQTHWVDQIVVATAYIGPLKKP